MNIKSSLILGIAAALLITSGMSYANSRLTPEASIIFKPVITSIWLE